MASPVVGEAILYSWWRRGGVEPPVQKTLYWNVLQAYSVFMSRSLDPDTDNEASEPADYLGPILSVSEWLRPQYCVA